LERELAEAKIAQLEAELAQARAEARAAREQLRNLELSHGCGGLQESSDGAAVEAAESLRPPQAAARPRPSFMAHLHPSSPAQRACNVGLASPVCGNAALSASFAYADVGSFEGFARQLEESKRALLPRRIIMVRHGESEGNVDVSTYQSKGDNCVELTATGSEQALEAGRRIRALLGKERVIAFVSPFQRTYQTLRNIRTHFEDSIVRTEIEPVLREQEFGNLQPEDFSKYREEQKVVGRFWYRFPTGESGADVYARVNLFWEALLRLNTNPQRQPVDNVLIVTHGLTMRLLLMRMYRWSPETFETVWNPSNCCLWVLQKDLSLDADIPYSLDADEGDMPKSSRRVKVFMKGGLELQLVLEDFIQIPPPRSAQVDIAKRMLAEQHGLVSSEIIGVDLDGDRKFARYR